MTIEAIWFIAGLLLICAELVVPGFVILFFGIGALVTSLVAWALPESDFVLQGWIFAIVSVVSFFVGRRFFRKALRGKRFDDGADADDDGVVGCSAEVVEAIAPLVSGRVSVRGVEWPARSDRMLDVGQRVTVIARENITLIVK